MKRLIRLFCLIAAATALGSCARDKVIPDEELARIFRDAYLINAYVSDRGVKLDSLELYEPVFSRYGYTAEDVRYTIGNFSRRKSAKLSDVVEQSIRLLEEESAYYKYEVGVLDTIDNVARRTFTRTVYADSLIRVGSLRDTARLRIAVDVQPGEYELRLKYLVDSLDRNEKGLRGVVWLENRDGGRSSVYSTTLRRNRTENFTRRFTVDTTHRRLHLDFLDFREKPLRPSVTVTGLEIDYIPTTSVAVDSLYRQQLDLRIFADEFLRAAIQADSL